MDILLPKNREGKQLSLRNGNRQITVVGANGSGKTRFVNQMMKNVGDGAFFISALNALFNSDEYDGVDSITKRYRAAMDVTQFVRPAADNEFDRLLYLLMTDEMKDMLAYKLGRTDRDDKEIPVTKIDTVIRLWKTVFPKNEVLRGSGLISFSNDNGKSPFKPVQLSHGEKAVFFYIGASLYAPRNSVIFVDSPTLFLHNSITQSLWSAIEGLRSDCTFVYQTHDLEFPASRTDNLTIWVRNCNVETDEWDYEILRPHESLSEQLVLDLIGSRKPVLFVEGDDTHSIDFKLYSLIFPDYTVKAMGSCNKVIETVRSFNDIRNFHHLDSRGIVDRDRRNSAEVKYLREKKILVPDVAEIENLMLLEGVVRTVAQLHGKDPANAFRKVKENVMTMFRKEIRSQALLHARHRVKRTMEVIVDQRFPNIGAMEKHLQNLENQIRPREIYDNLCNEFFGYIHDGDYNAVLRVFNQKSMLIDTNLPQICGVKNKDEYIKFVLYVLKRGGRESATVRNAIKRCFEI